MRARFDTGIILVTLLSVVALLSAGCGGPATAEANPPTATVPPIEATLALVNGTLIDGTGGEPLPDAVLLIDGERIVAVGSREGLALPEGARVIDVEGGTIMPGFINAHVHDAYDEERLETWAYEGVTTVRDEGLLYSSPTFTEALELRDAFAEEPRYARLLSSGYMLAPPEGYGGYYLESAEDARQKVAYGIEQGVDHVKFSLEDGYGMARNLPVFTDEEIATIVETAHAEGKLVSVHVTEAVYLERALDAGVDDMAHIPGDHVSDELIERLIAEDIYVVPTLTVFEAYGALFGARSNLRRFAEAGVKIALGNDYTLVPQNDFDHFDLGMPMHEIRRMSEADLTPMEVIVSATRNAAHVCGLEEELGTLEPGKLADVLVVNGDPLADLEALTDVRLVVHGGWSSGSRRLNEVDNKAIAFNARSPVPGAFGQKPAFALQAVRQTRPRDGGDEHFQPSAIALST